MNRKEQIAAKTDEMLENLSRLVRWNSVRSEPSEGAPFGAAPAGCLHEALEIAREMGFSVQNLDQICGWAEMGEGKDIIGIAAHLDIVPAGDGWNTDPFTLTRAGDRVYGRGTTDDKGPLIAALYAMQLVRGSGIPMKKRVRLLMGTAEETGSECMKYYVNHAEPVSCGFTPDGSFPGIHGEKGMMFMRLVSKKTKILRMEGGVVSNAVCGRCRAEVRACDADANALRAALQKTALTDFTVTEKDGILTVEAQGTAAHASLPQLGVNAAACTMQALAEAGMQDAFVDFYNSRIGLSTDGSGLGLRFADDYGALTLCNGTVRTENGVIICSLDLRTPVTVTEAQLRAACAPYLSGDGGTVEILSVRAPLFYPKDCKLVQDLYRAYVDVTGDTAHEPEVIGGGTYAKEIPGIIAFGCEFPGRDYHIHDANEFLEIPEWLLQVEIYAKAIENMLKEECAE